MVDFRTDHPFCVLSHNYVYFNTHTNQPWSLLHFVSFTGFCECMYVEQLGSDKDTDKLKSLDIEKDCFGP